MTPHIQDAIEALTKAVNLNCSAGALAHVNAALAALQAAPAPGSIDTAIPTWQERAEKRWTTEIKYLSDSCKILVMLDEIAALRAHIAQRAPVDSVALNLDAQLRAAVKERNELREKLAQRAASGDVADLMAVAEACAAQRCTIAMEDWLEARQAAPAPIADEVAGEWVLVPIAPTEEMILATRGPNMSEPSWNSYARKRHATLYKQMIAARPPAPRPSAPDAPAGELPPLPEYYPEIAAINSDEEERAKKYARAYALADRAAQGDHLKRMQSLLDAAYLLIESQDKRAARAAAAPAGHAEPVYQIANDSKPSGWSDVTKEVFDLHLVTTWRKKRILYAAPVAAEPAPSRSKILEIMRPYLDKGDGGYLCDTFPVLVIEAGQAILNTK